MSIFDTDFDKLDEDEREYDEYEQAIITSGGWGNGGLSNAVDAKTSAMEQIDSKIADALSKALPELEKMIAEGASSEDFAKKARGIASIKMIQALLSDDERLSQTAAEKIIERADGKAANNTPTQPTVQVNIIDANSQKDKEALARRMMFMEELMKRRAVPSSNIQDVEVIDA